MRLLDGRKTRILHISSVPDGVSFSTLCRFTFLLLVVIIISYTTGGEQKDNDDDENLLHCCSSSLFAGVIR